MPEEQIPEQALAQLRDAEMAHDLALLDLEKKLVESFPEEHAAVAHAAHLVARCKDDLIAAIGAYGALPADAKSPVGWAQYSSASKREYAPLSRWHQALVEAGLASYLPGIITERLNTEAIEQLIATSGQFHQAVEKLITTKLSKPALRYHWNPPEKEQP